MKKCLKYPDLLELEISLIAVYLILTLAIRLISILSKLFYRNL